MKLREAQLDSTKIGQFKELKSSINDKDLGMALNMVSKNLYSNPIGSFVREITSNAVDANVDANVDEPVKINIFQEEDSYFIEFIDNGVGMSPETFESIYMEWFNSDKRDTNNKIGGWGLGSKSPLSYQESFEIFSRYNGVKYHYIFINEPPVPTATLLSKEETNKPNGVTIKIEIKSRDDIYKVHTECQRQLAYFDKVYIKNNFYFYDNNFKIYDIDKFKIRTNPPYSVMHICLGQVTYPINWSTLDLEPIEIPIAVKFDIGEIEVTLNREEISYTDETKDLILTRVREVEEYILAKYKESLVTDDLIEYLNVIKERKSMPFKLGVINLDLSGYKLKPIFTPFKGLQLTKKYIDDLFCLYSIRYCKNGIYKTEGDLDANYLIRNLNSCYVTEDRVNTYDTAFLDEIHNGFYIIKKHKLNRNHINIIANVLGLTDDNNVILPGQLGKVGKVVGYINNFIKTKLKRYDGIADKEWVENYKEQLRERREESKLFLTTYNDYGNMIKKPLTELKKFSTVFYLLKGEEANYYERLHSTLPVYYKNKTTLIMITPSNVTKFKNKLNLVHIKNIFKYKVLNNFFYKCKLNLEIDSTFHDLTALEYSDYYLSMYRKLRDRYRNYPTWIATQFEEKLKNIKPSKKRSYLLYEDYIPILKEFQKKLDIMTHVRYGCPINYKIQILKTLKITKLSSEYYKSNLLIINSKENDNKEESIKETS